MSNPVSGERFLLSSDQPLDDPSQDVLGYGSFAKRLAEVVCRLSPKEGVVLAIYGAWGSGKSSLINFVKYYLRTFQEERTPIVFEFNPWWISGQEDLTSRYFRELLIAIGEEPGVPKAIASALAKLAESIAHTNLPYTKWAKLGAFLLGFFVRDKSLLEQQKAVVNALRSYDRNILVLIDDIDRLTAEEVRQVFHLVKAVGNFPRTIFLLAFDKKQVCEALKWLRVTSGEEYLEKIVQTPFDLPLPAGQQLYQLFSQRLDQIFADVPQHQFETSRWSRLFSTGVSPFLQTPRDVVRVSNAIGAIYPSVLGEVNLVDFVSIEALRVLLPDVYGAIRINSNVLTGLKYDYPGSPKPSELEKAACDAIVNVVPENERAKLKQFLEELFPRLQAIWGNHHYSDSSLSEWQRTLGACHPDHFQTYFRLSLASDRISNAEMQRIISELGSEHAFADTLTLLATQRLSGGDARANQFLSQLMDFVGEERVRTHASTIVTTFYRLADLLYKPEENREDRFYFGGLFWLFEAINSKLLKPLSQDLRYEILRMAMVGSEAVGFMCSEMLDYCKEHGKFTTNPPKPVDERFLNPIQNKQLESIVLTKIREAGGQNRLVNAPQLRLVLDCWSEWGGREEVRSWMIQVAKTDHGLTQILAAYLGRSRVSSGDNFKIFYYLDPLDLEPYMSDLATYTERVKLLAENQTISDEHRQAARAFVVGLQLRAQGKNPKDVRWDENWA